MDFLIGLLRFQNSFNISLAYLQNLLHYSLKDTTTSAFSVQARTLVSNKYF